MPKTRFRLTSEQRAAAFSRTERLYINAAPGSGKTAVAAERFGLQRWERGADARRILGLSFTRSASAELAGRIRQRWGEVALRWPHAVMTIDALHCEILTYLLRTGAITWPGGATELTVLDTWRGQRGARWLTESKDYRRQTTLQGTRVASRGLMVTRSGYHFSKAADFDSHLAQGRCTHDDVRHLVLAALQDEALKGKIGAYLRRTSRAVIVDEIFDANELDLALVWMAADLGLAVTVVGDPWQALYAFRGARPDLVPRMVDGAGFAALSIGESFRFATEAMRDAAAAARSGGALNLAPLTSLDACDVVLALKWQHLWEADDAVLPLSFGSPGNHTDAIVILLLDHFLRGRFNCGAVYGREAAALVGITPERLEDEHARFAAILETLHQELPGAPAAALAQLHDLIKVVRGRKPQRLKADAESKQLNRLRAFAQRTGRAHLIPGMTVHQAKGREWRTVGLRLTEKDVGRLGEGLRHDRAEDRVLYVAVTRAIERLGRC